MRTAVSKSAHGKYRKFIRDGRDYLHTRYDLLRLELLEKLSAIVAILILTMVGLALVVSVWVYVSCIFVVWMESRFDSFIPALLVMGGVNLVMLAVIFLMRERLILNPLISIFSKILFDPSGDDEQEPEADDDEEDETDENEI